MTFTVKLYTNSGVDAVVILNKAFPPAEARRIIRRLEIHYTPKHGSWLDMAEIELNVMTRQCLSRRIYSIDLLRGELTAWENGCNLEQAKIQCTFKLLTHALSLFPFIPQSYQPPLNGVSIMLNIIGAVH